MTTLNNVQNALFVPDIPFLNRFYNRNPTYDLSRNPTRISEAEEPETGPNRPQIARQISRQTNLPITRQISRKPVPPTPGPPPVPDKTEEQELRIAERGDSRTPEPNLLGVTELRRTNSITSHVEEDHYAVLPHGVTLEGWSDEDVEALDDYVRHMLHSRRSKFKRSMRGFGKYVKKRESYLSHCTTTTNMACSTRVFCHTVRFSYHGFWSDLGAIPYRLDLGWFTERLHCSYCRLGFGRSFRHHG